MIFDPYRRRDRRRGTSFNSVHRRLVPCLGVAPRSPGSCVTAQTGGQLDRSSARLRVGDTLALPRINEMAQLLLATTLERYPMNVLVFASRKGGSGKSTLAAHLAAYIPSPTRPCLLVDADPQGSLTLWQALRRTGEPPLKAGTRGIADIVKQAKRGRVEWCLIDHPPNLSATAPAAIRCATLVVIPARPGVFDIDAVKETIDFSRQPRTPYAGVINPATRRREERARR